uniref:Uncharacterized protein n=1 Tax=Oryza barthii TaxID=65489 RepID=A0A0D3G4J8_9ORYZ
MAKKKLKAPTMSLVGAITVHDLTACLAQWEYHAIDLYMSMPIAANHAFFGLELMTILFRTAPRKLIKNP